MQKFTILTVLAISLSACAESDEGAVQTDGGQTVKYDVDRNGGDTEVRVTGDDGEETVFNSGNDVAADLPDGYSLYPGAAVISATTMNQSDGQGMLVIMQSDAAPEEMVAFYRSQAKNAGVQIGMEMNSNGSMMVAGESEDGGTFSFNASSSGEGTTGQLVVGQGLN